MVQLIRPGQVKVTTENGEVELHITLDLNINLTTGDFNLTAASKTDLKKNNVDEEIVRFEVPKFESREKVKFGIREEKKETL